MQPDERPIVDAVSEPSSAGDDFAWPPPASTAIETFAPEAPEERAGNPLPRLSEVLESGVAFEWHHGVAIVQQVLSQLAPDGDAEGNFPDASRIWLTESGDLVAEFTGGPLQPLGGLGSLLQQTLSGRVQPAALRLLVMEATSPEPGVSLAVLRGGFAQWERPNRRQTIANLYAEMQAKNGAGRTVAAAAPAATSVLGAFARAVTRQAPAPPPAPAEARAPKHRRPVPPVIVFVVAGVVFTAVLLTLVFMPGSGPAETADTSAAGESASAATAENAATPGQPVAEIATAQPGEPPVAVPPGASPAATPAVNAVAGGASAPTGQASGAGSGTATAGSRQPAPASRPAVAPPRAAQPLPPGRGVSPQPIAPAAGAPVPPTRLALDRSASSVVPIQPIESPDAASSRSSRFADDTSATDATPRTPLYSTMDSAVLAPVPLSTLPPAAEPNTSETDLAVLELVIDTSGRVESARLLNTVQHFRDRWWIAAAKTWAFQPALLNGRPVRYRTRLTFMNGAALGPPVADR